jgi:arsenate reductase
VNIQIFSGIKNFDTQKTERYFKERGIRFQRIDLNRQGLSKGELTAVKQVVGLSGLIDQQSPEYHSLNMAYHGLSPMADELLLNHQGLLKTPIVRNGRQATVGYCPEIWQTWT